MKGQPKMDHRIIFHIDVNNAFLSWEAVNRLETKSSMSKEHSLNSMSKISEEISLDVSLNGSEDIPLDLRTIPSAIGGDRKTRHGVILAKSTPAKKYNVITGEPIQKALQKCPDLVLVPPNHRMYGEYSKKLLQLLYKYTPNIEPYSIDEAFLDMTGIIQGNISPKDYALKLKDYVKHQLGFTVNIGISTNKLLAKMASDFKKPDMVHTLFPSEIPAKMWPLPVNELFLVGKSTEKTLRRLGLRTIGDVAHTDLSVLKSHLGHKYGETVYNNAWGINDDPVEIETPVNKGYGNSVTLAKDVTDSKEANLILLSLSESVASRLRQNHLKCYCITVETKDHNFKRQSHQTSLLTATNTTNIIYETSCKLLKELWDGTPLRLLGIRGSKLTTEEYNQLNLFETSKNEKLEKLDKTLDSIRNKFGKNSVLRASLAKQDEKK